MIVEQLWTASSLRNFNYLIVCPETGEALAIDPLDHKQCLTTAHDRGWDITQVFNTHEHHDHIGGNQQVVDATHAQLLAHADAVDVIPGVDRALKGGDVIKVGNTVELEVLDTPGHTFCHICLFAHTDLPALFCGDTLFNAGVGNCFNGGDPEVMYQTFAGQLSRLPDSTSVYPGHDYITNNLKFTLDREPDNGAAQNLLAHVKDQDPNQPLVTNLALEQQTNTFLRLQSPAVIARLRQDFPDLPDQPDPKTVFVKLRALRDDW